MLFLLIFVVVALVGESRKHAAGEYRHIRDQHAQRVAAEHPEWSAGRVRRRAARHASSYWGQEIFRGFPTMRSAFREDRTALRIAREEQRDKHETRMGELRAALDEIRRRRAAREEYVRANSGPDATLAERAELRRQWDEQAAGVAGGAPPAAAAPAPPPPPPVTAPPPVPAPPVTTPPSPPPPPPPPPAPAPAPVFRSHPTATAPTTPAAPAPWPTLPPPDGANAAVPASEPEIAPRDTADPGHPAGLPDNDEGETDMTHIDAELSGHDSAYEAVQAVLASAAEQATALAQLVREDLPAAIAVHGFGRDAQLATDLAQLDDSAEQFAVKATAARTGFANRHVEGAEYHADGQGADRSGFVGV